MPMEAVQRAQQAFTEYSMAIGLASAGSNSDVISSPNAVHWCSPVSGFVKLNDSDATWPKDQQQHGMGYILRNDVGAPVLVVSEPSSFLSPAIGEAMALRSGVIQAISAGFSHIEVESDNAEIIQLLQGCGKLSEVALAAIESNTLRDHAMIYACLYISKSALATTS
ncbi:hypothetical protein NE237_029088 [Protea cynaroides]|uniref:RNase H type-1 domain-containing protein n=1 Tax=Protea cynaroides TaxID=273540 RepID=A0A9Q0GSH7_9MAGN|nr:hypothetical protein NE237_029088 [Protea cynaroides]